MMSATDAALATAEPKGASADSGAPVDAAVFATVFGERLREVSAETLQALARISRLRHLGDGTLLFREGAAPHGVFFVRSGRIKLTFNTRKGQHFLLETAGPGEILGLGATVCGKAHETTAEAMSAVEAIYIRRADFLKFLRDHADVCIEIIRALTSDLEAAYDRVRSYRLR